MHGSLFRYLLNDHISSTTCANGHRAVALQTVQMRRVLLGLEAALEDSKDSIPLSLSR